MSNELVDHDLIAWRAVDAAREAMGHLEDPRDLDEAEGAKIRAMADAIAALLAEHTASLDYRIVGSASLTYTVHRGDFGGTVTRGLQLRPAIVEARKGLNFGSWIVRERDGQAIAKCQARHVYTGQASDVALGTKGWTVAYFVHPFADATLLPFERQVLKVRR